MTERLYYTEPGRLEFEATIRSIDADGDRFAVRLDRSAFYPTSGGQLADRGALGGIPVLDVVEADDGDVVHLLEQPPGQPGQQVAGRVDEARRTRHRQQHSAQHVLSQVLIRLFEADTVSVHLGEEYGAVEVAKDSLTDQQLRQAEREANRILMQNLPITIRFETVEAAKSLPVRKIPEREGTIRLIQIGELDYSACGGTHCDSTSEIGIIKILGATKQRGNTLVTFLAGMQALEDYQVRYDISESLARDLTCHVGDLPDKLTRITEENKAQRQQITALQKELLPVRAEQLASEAESVGQQSLVVARIGDLDPKVAAQLASATAERTAGTVLFGVENRLLLATGAKATIDARTLVATLCEKTGLRGGGSPTAAQIGGADPQAFDTYCRLVKEILTGA